MAEMSDNVIRLDDSTELPSLRPRPPVNPGIGIELLFNRSKVSPEVMSMCSDDDADADLGFDRGGPADDPFPANDDDDDYGPPPPRPFAPPPPPHQSTEEITREKRELLWQFDNMASKGIKVPTFTMSDGLPEMKDAMTRVVREREQDASVRFQRKAIMACVSGIEFLNSRFNPADVHLDGWSETVNDSLTIGDYDDIFVELAEKYKMSGKRFAPELRLLFSLGGSGLMFHLSHTMLKNSAIPGIDAVLKSNPQLMRQVASAAAKMGGSVGRMGGSGGSGGGGGGGGLDLGSMFNVMAGLGAGGGGGGGGFASGSGMTRQAPPQPPPPSQPQPQATMRGPADMSDLMRHLHGGADRNAERFEEVMSVTDSDISSILDGTGEGSRRRSRAKTPKRMMNI